MKDNNGYKDGLFVGRFQPVHNGHVKAIRHALGKCKRLIVLVGSSQKSYEPQDPFTVGQRIEMLHQALTDEGVGKNCIILSVPDIQNNALWVSHIESLVPSFDIVFSNNPLVKRLFEDAGYKVESSHMFARETLEGTRIRRLMFETTGEEWRHYVPKAVAEFVKRNNAIWKIKSIMGTDKA
ncbi:nicotinamide-nucleotide adenylyltransferase [Candidatus Parvarchaeota archaeon]|nr:nicotinamide-nucleotide adenylyltransferase [Candidatus Parvarchaeota archaeon]